MLLTVLQKLREAFRVLPAAGKCHASRDWSGEKHSQSRVYVCARHLPFGIPHTEIQSLRNVLVGRLVRQAALQR